jgi:hypothetical protein
MADLDQVLGAVLSSLAQARRMADEQTSAIAQYYQSNPLLKGMTAPRIRMPEVVVDVPLIIDEVDAGRPPVFASPPELAALAVDAAVKVAQQQDVPMSAAVRDKLNQAIRSGLEVVLRDVTAGKTSPDLVQESLAAVANEAMATPVEQVVGTRITALNKAAAAQLAKRKQVANAPASRAAIAAGIDTPPIIAQRDPVVVRAAVLAAARDAIRMAAIKEPGRAATLKTSVLTSEIKERSNPDSVTRLKLVLREEGMEWQEVKRADGSSSAMLTPE